MSIKNARTLSIRLSAEDTARLASFENSTGVEAVTLGRAALLAALDYFELHRSLTFPLRVAPEGLVGASPAPNSSPDPKARTKKSA